MPYILGFLIMDTVSVNKFRETLKDIVSAEDWEQEQETLYVLQNINLMQQIAKSMTTHCARQGYSPTPEQTHEILSV